METSFGRIDGSILVSIVVLALAVTVSPIHADSIGVVTARTDLPANETLDWSGFGSVDADVPNPGSLTTSSGLIVTVSEPEYGLGLLETGLPANESGSWNGDFPDGEILLSNWNSPFAITLSFSSPVFGAGVQVEPAHVNEYPEPFTAFVTAYDGDTNLGQFSISGMRGLGQDIPAPFLGVASDTAEITSLVYRVSTPINEPSVGDMAMNFLSLETVEPAPEPSSVLLAAVGLALLVTSGAPRHNVNGMTK